MLNEIKKIPDSCEVVVAPTAVHTQRFIDTIRPEIACAAQNISSEKGYGAFTGELTAEMFKDLGCSYVLTGHSERRRRKTVRGLGHDEEAGSVADKTSYALQQGLKVILCIGETLQDRENGSTLDVCRAQLQAVLDQVPDTAHWANDIVIAYEPVWAIGTGVTASPAQAQEVHAALRVWLTTTISAEVASKCRIIYGGSVNGSNAAELIKGEDVDGFLVGGASLKPDFVKIIESVPKEWDHEGRALKRQKTEDHIKQLSAGK